MVGMAWPEKALVYNARIQLSKYHRNTIGVTYHKLEIDETYDEIGS